MVCYVCLIVHTPPMRYRHWVLILLSLLSAITYLDRVCISVAGPRIQQELRISPQSWGWVVGVFAIAYGLFELPGGLMSDRMGPRRVLTRIVLWWSAFTILTGRVSNYSLLLLVRFCFGAGEAGAYPGASSSISRWFPVAERARAFGIVWMASQAGGALAPLLVVPIQAMYGWRASFYVFGLLGVVWSAVWFLWYRDNPLEKTGITAAELAEIAGNSRRETIPLPWRRVFRQPNFWAVLGVALTYCYAMYFFLAWLPTYLVKGRGFSEQELTLSTAPFLLGVAANAAGGWVGDMAVKRVGLRMGRRAVGIAGLTLAAASMLGAAFVPGKYGVLLLLALGYAGITFQQPSVWAVCLDIGKRHAGAVSGAMNTAGQFGSFLLSISFGYFLTRFGSFDLALIPIAGALLAGAGLWFVVDPNRELLPEP